MRRTLLSVAALGTLSFDVRAPRALSADGFTSAASRE